MKKLIYFIVLSLFIFVGCSNSTANKAIEQGKLAISEKDFQKAKASFQLALDEDKDNETAKNFYSSIDTFLKSKELYDKGSINEAKEALSKISLKEKSSSFLEEVEKLKSTITNTENNYKSIDNNISQTQDLIIKKSYDDALKKLNEIDKNKSSKTQIETINKLITTVNNEKTKESEKAKKIEEKKATIKQNTSSSMSKSKALSIAKSNYPQPEYKYSPSKGGSGEFGEDTFGNPAYFFTFEHVEYGLYGVWVSKAGSCYARNVDY